MKQRRPTFNPDRNYRFAERIRIESFGLLG
jgi:hypothetical protein